MFGNRRYGPSRIRWLLIGLVIGILLGLIFAHPTIGVMDIITGPGQIVEVIPWIGGD